MFTKDDVSYILAQNKRSVTDSFTGVCHTSLRKENLFFCQIIGLHGALISCP